jgi:hypothetical protein
MNITRPDEPQIATVVADIPNKEAEDGRYSEGSHKSFAPLWVIQVWSSFKPYPHCSGKDSESW